MKKRMTAILSVVLAVVIAGCVFVTTTAAASPTISYSFKNNDKGFAEGTVSLANGSGSVSLYWADDSKALDGFDPIATFNGSGSYTMPAYTAIPARATKVAAFTGSNLSLSNAVAVYNIPDNKKLGKTDKDLLYSFASYSDIHMEDETAKPYNGYTAKYPYDEQHLRWAFDTAAKRDVDFIITTGDHVNNQRNDNNGGNNNLYAYEWSRYLKILADSDFTGPVYEAVGNHELWNFETDSNKKVRDAKTGLRYFTALTGLDSTVASVKSDKAYYEITEPTTGDHFLFMALEGGFYTDSNDEFTDAQLNWLDSKITEYEKDGKNIFIMEHANFNKWGAGDQLDNPIYDIPLKDSNAATTKLKNILMKHKDAVIITGHTHFKYSLQLNYSDNGKTSATMIHNSSIGAVRDIKNRVTRVNDTSKELSEGYIVEVYDNATIFYGTNVYYNKTNPSATYIIAQTTSAIDKPEPTEAPTQKPTEAPTQKPTEKPSEAPLPTFPPKPTETEGKDFIWGDVDGDGDLQIVDATAVQRYLANLITLSDEAIARGKVTGNAELTVIDATAIQRKLAGLIPKFIVETALAATGAENIEIAEVGADLNTLRTQVNTALTKYWQLSSYDQYLALKKAYKENADYDTLNAAYTAFNQAVKDFYPGDNITVQFTAPSGWGSTVYAYAYNSDSDKLAAWPGKACTKVSGNIWSITIPNGKYNFIIFSDGNGGHQTYDLALGITGNQGYKTSGSGSKVNGVPYQY